MAGFAALTKSGPNALKAEALARQIGTTKGSFYWHFKDVRAFHAALLELWESRAVTEIIALVEQTGDPMTRLTQLLTIAAQGGPEQIGGTQIEPAIRAWARAEPLAAAAVARIDARRMAYLDTLCDAVPMALPHAGRLLYASLVGHQMIDTPAAQASAHLTGLTNLLTGASIAKPD